MDPTRSAWPHPRANEYAYCLGEPVDFYDPLGLLSAPGYRPDFPNTDFLRPDIEYLDPAENEELHLSLQLAGYVPGVGISADVADATLYFSEGNYVEGTINLIGTVPVVGDAIEITWLILEVSGAISEEDVEAVNYYIQEFFSDSPDLRLMSPLGKKGRKWVKERLGGGKGGKANGGKGKRGKGGSVADRSNTTSCDGSRREGGGRN